MKKLSWVVVIVLWVFLQASTVNAQGTLGNGQTRETPLAIGAMGRVGDYEVRVLEVTPDATAIVMSENQFNDPPAPGNVFFMARVEVTYLGPETGTPWIDLDFSVVGSANRGYTTYDFDCGTIPDSGYDAPELFQSGVAEFNVCWSVPQAEIGTFVMYVEQILSNGNPIWFALDVLGTVQPEAPLDVGGVATPASATEGSAATQVQGPLAVGQTQVTWTGNWQYDASSSMESQVSLTQVDVSTGTIKLATYGEFWDSTVVDATGAIDTFAQAFFQGAGATSVVWAGNGVLPNGSAWRIYTFELEGLQLTFLVTASQMPTGEFRVLTLTANTNEFEEAIGLAQQEIFLNGQPVYLEGVTPSEVLGS